MDRMAHHMECDNDDGFAVDVDIGVAYGDNPLSGSKNALIPDPVVLQAHLLAIDHQEIRVCDHVGLQRVRLHTEAVRAEPAPD